MPELISSIAARLRRFVGNRRHAQRRLVRLTVHVSSAGGKKDWQESRSAALEAYTRDLSLSGLSIIVPAIRIGSRYLTDQDRTLHIQIELPDTTIQLRAVSVRYEQLVGEEKGYLIGARIIEMSQTDRKLFLEYIKSPN
ncbi:MAG: PilZ domain-containing protein [Pyrinomonadaceae bacterium]|nr:PilZ domain-containing protein [Pyrinomonadaceae bacterium]